ncbi:MAG: site-specific integrase [Planctomycetes bacterium]|nr:site-specific integrase [Planctomycetota bacterium]
MVALAQGKARVSRSRRWKARDLAVLVLAGQQGLRVGEIAALRIGHLERLTEGILYVPTLKLRERERGTVDESLVDRGVQAALERYLRTIDAAARESGDHPLFFNPKTGRALSRRALQNVWRLYAERAGVSKSIHAGRHLAATEAVKQGGLKLAKRKLRHRSLSSTLVYEDIDFERERELLEKARVV